MGNCNNKIYLETDVIKLEFEEVLDIDKKIKELDIEIYNLSNQLFEKTQCKLNISKLKNENMSFVTYSDIII